MINFDLLNLVKNSLYDFHDNDEIYKKILSGELCCLNKDIKDESITIISDKSQFGFVDDEFKNNECKLFLYNEKEKKYQYITKNNYKKLLFSKITVCPYCNKNSFSGIDDDRKISYDLDHFLLKSKYSKYGLSIFNIIPSCKDCNSSFNKGKREYEANGYYHNIFLGWVYYLKTGLKISNSSDFDEKFIFEIDGIKSVWKLLDKNDNKYKKHKDFFSLDDLYKIRNQVERIYENFIKNRDIILNNKKIDRDIIEGLFREFLIKNKEILNIEYGKMRKDLYLRLKNELLQKGIKL